MVDTNPNVLCIFDVEERKQIRQVPLPPGRSWDGTVCRTAWSTGGLLAIADPYGELFVLDPITQDDPLFQARFDPTENAGRSDADISSVKQLWGGVLAALAWSPDDRYLAAFMMGKLGVFDLASGATTFAPTPPIAGAETLAWSLNWKHLACQDGTGTVWIQTPPISGTWKRYAPEESCEPSLAWSPSGDLLVAGGPMDTLRIIDPERQRSKTIAVRGSSSDEREERAVAAAPSFVSEDVLAVGLNEPPSITEDPDNDVGTVCLVNVGTGQVSTVLPAVAIQGVRLLRFTGKRLVCVDWWGMCSVLDLENPGRSEEWFTQDFAYASNAVARWNPDSERVAFADYFNIIVLNNATGKLLRLRREATSVQAAGWDGDGRRFATEDDGGRLTAYEVTDTRILPTVGPVRRSDFLLTGRQRRNAESSDRFYQLFDQYLISPDNRHLLALGFDTLRVFAAPMRFSGYQLDLFPSMEDSGSIRTQYCVWDANTWEIIEESGGAHQFMKKVTHH